jgi:hypothetical protein
MSIWDAQIPASHAALRGAEGELVSVRITVDPRLLEELLDALAEMPFPVNPQICHHASYVRDGRARPAVLVDFPAYAERVEEANRILRARGFADRIEVHSMLAEIQTA